MLDIVGKHLGVPIHQVLGGFREWAPLYVGGLCLGWKDVDELCAEAKKYVDQGFKAMKLRVGRGLAQDVECVSRVRQTVGPDVRIMVDANQGYSDRDAMKIIKKYEECDLFWLEEPVPHEKLATMARLRGHEPGELGRRRELLHPGRLQAVCWTLARWTSSSPTACKIGGIGDMRKVAVVGRVPSDRGASPHYRHLHRPSRGPAIRGHHPQRGHDRVGTTPRATSCATTLSRGATKLPDGQIKIPLRSRPGRGGRLRFP